MKEEEEEEDFFPSFWRYLKEEEKKKRTKNQHLQPLLFKGISCCVKGSDKGALMTVF